MIQAVILDLDGLMIYSEDVGLDAWQLTLAPYGKRMSEETYRSLIGTSQNASIEHVITHMGVAASMEDLDREYWAALEELVDRGIRPMPGVHEIIDNLRRRGLRLGVASNSVTPYVRKALTQIGVLDAFACCVGVEQVVNGKPAPDLYLYAAQLLGCAPNTCLAVEDSPPGVQAAVDAGMRCALIPNPELSLADGHGAHFVFPSLVELDKNLEAVLST